MENLNQTLPALDPDNSSTPTPASATPTSEFSDADLDSLLSNIGSRRESLGIEDRPAKKKRLPWEEPTEIPPPLSEAELAEARRQQAERALQRQAYERRELWRTLSMEIGSRYVDCRLNNFAVTCDEQRKAIDLAAQYAAEMAVHVRQGEGVLLFGPAGTGKDHIMAALTYAAIMQHGFRVDWHNGMDLFGRVRDRIEADKSEADFIHEMYRPAILAISDPLPPSGPLTPFQSQMMFRIVDKRYRENRPTWLTLNVSSGAEAAERIGVQTYDRLRHSAMGLFCNWPSYRKAK